MEPLWYNNKFKINNKSIFFKELYEKGIYCVGHLNDNNIYTYGLSNV